MTYQISSLEDYKQTYQHSIEDPEGFWTKQAETFTWRKPWDNTLSWNFDTPDIKWFEGGQLNITENCLDRHIAERGDQVAILWEPNNPEDAVIRYTYSELLVAVCKCANALKEQGIVKGDRVVFYMPMVPELAIAILACARIGAIHSVVFAGFSAQALADRVNDASAKMIICSDYNNRGAKNIPVKQVVDDALALGCPSVKRVIVHNNSSDKISLRDLDVWYNEVVDSQSDVCEPEIMDAEDMLFILYTSGSTGKPKGVVHTCGGYMVYTCYTFKNYSRYRLDHWTLLHYLWTIARRSDYDDV